MFPSVQWPWQLDGEEACQFSGKLEVISAVLRLHYKNSGDEKSVLIPFPPCSLVSAVLSG